MQQVLGALAGADVAQDGRMDGPAIDLDALDRRLGGKLLTGFPDATDLLAFAHETGPAVAASKPCTCPRCDARNRSGRRSSSGLPSSSSARQPKMRSAPSLKKMIRCSSSIAMTASAAIASNPENSAGLSTRFMEARSAASEAFFIIVPCREFSVRKGRGNQSEYPRYPDRMMDVSLRDSRAIWSYPSFAQTSPMSNTTSKTSELLTSAATSRRAFLRTAGFTAVGAGALVACGKAGDASTQKTPAAAPHDMGSTSAATATPAAAAQTPRQAADAMDAMHEAGIKAFPAKSAGKGNQLLAPKIVAGVKVFELTAKEIKWETAPGQSVRAFAYNDQVPGPQIRVREGDRVRVVLKNELAQSTAIHFHGMELPNDQDGVPFITQPPVKPGETYTYEFTIPEGNVGSNMYHSHHNAAMQVQLGLLGAFIVEPKKPRAIEKADRGLRHDPQRWRAWIHVQR